MDRLEGMTTHTPMRVGPDRRGLLSRRELVAKGRCSPGSRDPTGGSALVRWKDVPKAMEQEFLGGGTVGLGPATPDEPRISEPREGALYIARVEAQVAGEPTDSRRLGSAEKLEEDEDVLTLEHGPRLAPMYACFTTCTQPVRRIADLASETAPDRAPLSLVAWISCTHLVPASRPRRHPLGE